MTASLLVRKLAKKGILLAALFVLLHTTSLTRSEIDRKLEVKKDWRDFKNESHFVEDIVVSNSAGAKPIMHTFFEPSQDCCGMTEKGHTRLLKVWEESWQAIGWETKILTKEDAMKHPDFDQVNKKLNLLQISPYDRRCLWRWLAMAAGDKEKEGGGWMSDYDTFPMGLSAEEGLDIASKPGFKSYSYHVPCIIHASREEWDKVLQIIINIIPSEGKLPGNDLVSDMNLLLHAYWRFGKKAMGISIWRRGSIGFPYTKSENGELVVRCNVARIAKVFHLSHHDCERAYDENIYPQLDGLRKSDVFERRSEAAIAVIRDYTSQCID